MIFGVVVPVEAPHLIWTIVRAISRANTAVVDLLVQTFRTHRRGQYRADRFAWSVLAVLAHHGLVNADRIIFRTTVLAVNADPLHKAVSFHLIFSLTRIILLPLATSHLP